MRHFELARGLIVLRLAVSVAIFIVFACAAQYFIGWRSLVYPWLFMEEQFGKLAAMVALIGLTYVIRALRVFRYFRLPTGFTLCLRVLTHHTLLVNVLPMHAGEVAFPALMKRYFNMPLRRSLPALVWLRALDLHVLLSIPLCLLAVSSLPFAFAALAWLTLPLAAFLVSGRVSVPAAPQGKLWRIARDLIAAVPRTASEFFENWLLTLINWVLKLAVFAWVIELFSGQRYVAAVSGAIGGELSTVLPVQGLANIGTYEAGVVAAMRPMGVSASAALTGAVNLHLLFLGVSFCGALLALLVPMQESRHIMQDARASMPETRI